ncbi:hypothetical protein [Streptomyces sp. NPDC050264]|uniref:hypothetical protein n=1 Tax=Streptomyces sp. NPDC050264 TaxID=3155038 RepID=UPI00341631DF
MTRTSKKSRKTKRKGRRHRTVNRTPRPVGAARPDRPSVPRTQTGEHAPVAAVPAPASEDRVEPARVLAPREGEPADGAAALNRTTRATWSRLRQEPLRGWTVEEVSEAVGFTPRTVVRHLQTLAAHDLACQDSGGEWRATAGATERSSRAAVRADSAV